MTTSSTLTRWRSVAASTAAAAFVAALVLVPAGSPAAAAPVTIGTCTFVEAPTPEVHTECPGADLRMSVGMEGGLDLRWANLEGANLSGTMLLIAASSIDHIRLAGADLTGTTVGYYADLTGGSLKGAHLDGASIVESNLVGLDLSGTDFSNANIRDSDLSGTNLDGARFDGAQTGGVSIAGATVAGTYLPANLDGGSAAGVDFSVAASLPAETTMRGTDMTGAIFDGLTIDGLNVEGSELAASSFDGVQFVCGSSFLARGANFTDGSFAGVDFHAVRDLQMQGAYFAFVDFTNSNVRIFGGGYYADADFDGATIYGNGQGAIFHRASMVGVEATGDDGVVDQRSSVPPADVECGGSFGQGEPMTLQGAQFHDADLTDADLDLSILTGAIFVRSDLVRARIQSEQLYGLSGIVIVDSDLTDAVLPPAMNLYGWDSQKWLYGIFIENSAIDGSSLANVDVAVTAPTAAPTAVTFGLPAAFENADGKLPYDPTYDGDY